ncbi:exodeoxyribonuclease V subunit beta [Tahibacter amnicola]|uniref:RecBCD enzyme subunit RecB n=1 Tax=Tahibacter amnicola TaxID=2976241 RepID=A0ABY6BLH8_9GAMM|nr:exodeoxyribonuclease V subunit beta [Tahibacter amnicola]UXI68667.1 exodeoxyribonuclease V subunit beta [Tahibacter amnicola]
MSVPQPLDPMTFPLRGVRLIEASAGTGKTWTIAALYLRLVLGHGCDGPLLPPQILVVTFTRAATAELRERIRARLVEAAAVFRSGAAVEPFLQALLATQSDAAARATAAARLELAAQWMDEAAIYTIDAWSQRMLSQFAIGSGSPFDFDLVEDESELIVEATRDYWRSEAYALDTHQAAWLVGTVETPDALAGLLRNALGRRTDNAQLTGIDPSIPLGGSLREVMTAMAGSLHRHKRECAAQVEALQAFLDGLVAAQRINGARLKPSRYTEWLSRLRAWAEDAAPVAPALTESAWERLTVDGIRNALKDDGPVEWPAALAAVGTLRTAVAQCLDLQGVLVAHAVDRVRERIIAAKRRRATLGFDDVKRRLELAVSRDITGRLAVAIAAQYPVALVDEFQDTDAVQWRLFHGIYGNHPSAALLLIGDPKQAIYSFRGADIHTYLAARESAEQPRYTLSTNFRSTAPLVGAVNRLFEHGMQWPDGPFAFGAAGHGLPFHPVDAAGRASALVIDGNPVPAMHLWLHAPDDAPGKARYMDVMAAATTAEVARLLSLAAAGRCGFAAPAAFAPLRPADIAILVRDVGEARVMRAALDRAGLRSVYLSDRDSVYDTAEAADVLTWLGACAEPGEERRLRSALATATLDLPWSQLDALNHDEAAWEQQLERFRRYQQVWRSAGVLAMLTALLHEFDVPARCLARAGGERALTNVLHLAELLQEASVTLDGEGALVRHLRETIAGDVAGDAALLRLESDAGLLKLVTVHKSKGLEYPLVFLPFACNFREVGASGPRRTVWYAWHGADGRLHLDVSLDEVSRRRADRERLQEELRLLYVAVTRASFACWIGVAALRMGNAKVSQLHKSAVGYLLKGGEAIAAGELASLLARLAEGQSGMVVGEPPGSDGTRPQVPAPVTLALARPYRGAPPPRWWIASYSALRLAGSDSAHTPGEPETAGQAVLAERVHDLVPLAEAISEQLAPLAAFPRGAAPGTFLHGLLEWSAQQGFAQSLSDTALLTQTIARRCQRRGLAPWIGALSRWMQYFLTVPLACAEGTVSLAALPMTHYQAELEFWFEAAQVDVARLDRLVTQATLDAQARPPLEPDRLNGLLKGFIDLVFCHAGRYYVVDYKSNWLGPDAAAYDAATLRQAILVNRYDMQYCLYILALHRQLRARLPDYDYDRHVGGAMYLFLRGVDTAGHGVHRERPPRALIEHMDRLFAGAGAADA